MHILPPDFEWEEGTPKYSEAVRGYIRASPVNSAAVTIDIYGSMGWQSGDIHDGYNTLAQLPPFNANNPPTLNAAATGVLSTNSAVGHVYRELSSFANCKVSWNGYIHRPQAGAFQSDHLRTLGVIARQQNGTASTSGSFASLRDFDCYCFGLWSNAAVGARFLLLRINLGIVTVLGASDEIGTQLPIGSGTGFDPLAKLRLDRPFTLRLELSDEAGNVRIKCYFSRIGGTLIPIIQTTLLIDVLDASASKITSAGRFGFFEQRERTINTVRSVAICNWWQVDLAGVTALREEWKRPWPADPIIDAYVKSGKNLAPMMIGDFAGGLGGSPGHGLFQSTPAALANRAMGCPRLTAGSPCGQAAGSFPYFGGFFFQQRSAPDRVASRRSAVFRFSTNDDLGAASTEHVTFFQHAGIFLRASVVQGSQNNAPSSGYFAIISPGGTGLAWVRLWRLGGVGIAEEIANRLTGVTLPRDADHTLEMQVINVDDGSGSPLNAIVVLSVLLNGVAVTFSSAGASGVTVLPSGLVFDASSVRWMTGVGEGVRIYAPKTGTNDRAIYVDQWRELVPQNPTGGGDDDQPTIPLDCEDVGISATLVCPAEWPVTESRPFQFDHFPMEDAYEVTKLRYGQERRVFAIIANASKPSELVSLRSFWNARQGCVNPFFWVPPLEAAPIKVHFADETIEHMHRAPSVRAFKFGLEEVLC